MTAALRCATLLFVLLLLATSTPAQDPQPGPGPAAQPDPVATESRPFDWDVTVPPGGYAVARFDSATGQITRRVVSTVASGPTYGPDDARLDGALTDDARRAVDVTPEWLRRDLRVKLADLRSQPLQNEAAVSFSTVRVTESPTDDETRLIVLNAQGDTVGEVAAQPTTSVERSVSLVSVLESGAVQVTPAGSDGVAQELKLPFTPRDATLFDLEGDGHADLVLLDETGTVRVLRNRGTSAAPAFIVPRQDSIRSLPDDVAQTAVVPRLVRVRDDLLGMAVGTQDGWLRVYVRRDGEWTMRKEQQFDNVSNIAIAAATNRYLLAGLRDGRIARFDVDAELETLFDGRKFGTYAAPTIGDLTGDGHADLVICTREGDVWLGAGVDPAAAGPGPTPTFTMPEKIAGLSLKSAVPVVTAAHQLLVGLPDGTLQVWNDDGGEWAQVESTPFGGIDVGEYAAPAFCDLDGDGQDELIIGNGQGQLTQFSKSGEHWLERDSWSFLPMAGINTLDDYYGRTIEAIPAWRVPTDDAAVNAFAAELLNAKPEWRDEIASVIANTPTEVLRTMHRLEQTDVVSRNARMVYEMADIAKYARLSDENGVTSLELYTARGWVGVPQELYYRFVVHPRILFEIPARVDVSWWATSAAERGMTRDDWLRHDGGNGGMLYGTSDSHRFWREALLTDEMKNRQLIDYVRDCETQEDAIFALSRYLSYAEPDAFMSFGYLTNDLQPLLIYAKGYGSCGETSTICSTICRLLLIPAYIVGCRGEDHQWSEVWDAQTGQFAVWNCDASASNFGHIWGPGEGGNHGGKTISTIMAFGPDDAIWPTTTSAANPAGSGYMPDDRGYTPTAHVTIRVQDANGLPVDGAMVVARSHWNRANMLSMLQYTDLSGRCTFDLGWEPHGGYTIDVLSSLGTAGSMSLPVTEGESYEVTYRLPGTLPSQSELIVNPDGTLTSDGVKLRVRSTESFSQRVYARSFFTGQRYRISSQIGQKTGYTGTRWYPQDQAASCGQAVLMNQEHFRAFVRGEMCTALPLGESVPAGDWFVVCDNRNSLNTWQRFHTAFDMVSPAADPELTVAAARLEARMGDYFEFTGTATDASGIASVDCSVDGGRTWMAADQLPSADGMYLFGCDGRNGSVLMLPGDYSLQVRATDNTGRITTRALPLTITPTRTFPAQRIQQDDAGNPLSASWVLGPFTIPADERSLSISTRGHTDGMDVDVFLYADRNGNRTREDNEKIADSTTPTSNERLFVDEPDTNAVYWLYIHGWQVPEATGRLDVTLSFEPGRVQITELSPAGVINRLEAGGIRARIDAPADAEVIARVDMDPWEITRDESGRVVLVPPPGVTLQDGDHIVTLEVPDLAQVLHWQFTLDSTPPSVEKFYSEGVDDTLRVEVQVADSFSGVAGVTAALADDKAVRLKQDAEHPELWTGRVPRINHPPGEIGITLTVTDQAGNTTTDTRRVKLPMPPQAPPAESVGPVTFFRIHPGKGTPDTRPTIQAYWRLQEGVAATRVRARVTNADGKVVAEREQAASPLGYIAFRPVEPLAPGEYTMRVELTLAGNHQPAVHESTFTVAPMTWQDDK